MKFTNHVFPVHLVATMHDRPRIGIWLGRTYPYWVQVNEAVFTQGQQLPVDLISLASVLEFTGNTESDQDKLFEDILSFGLSALICMYIPQQTLLRLLITGLPVIQVTETDLMHPNLVSFEGNYACASLAGQYAADRLTGRGRILVIGGLWDKDGERGESRIQAIADVVAKFPSLTLGHIPAPWAHADAYSVIERALKADSGPVDAIVGISDPLALAARHAGHALGLITPKTVIVGINGDPLALVAVAEGSLAEVV